MKEYDIIVLGAGDVGLGIAFNALSEGARVALIEKGNVGGTCVNVGCVPSKTLISAADRIMDIREAGKFGISARIDGIDFSVVMGHMRDAVMAGRQSIREGLSESGNLDLYEGQGRFVSAYTLQVGDERISGRKIFIASGTRPFIPPIRGLDKVGYLTNESLLDLREVPRSIIIAGGGYIGVEYAHFFEAMGAKVSLIERNERLVRGEEPEISRLLQRELEKRLALLLNTEITEIGEKAGGCLVLARDILTGETREIEAERILVATGRQPNSDLLDLKNAGIQTDGKGFIKVNDYLETGKENIWALGDAIGMQMFTHAGDLEAEIAWNNSRGEDKKKMDFSSVPHAVFTHPQIASVGLTEEAAGKAHDIVVGLARYSDTVKGTAIQEKEGFAKAVVDKKTGRILGFHIIGPQASILIQEIVNIIVHGNDKDYIMNSIHIFPALSELVPEALNNLK